MYKVTVNENTYQVDLMNGRAKIDGQEVSWDLQKTGENTYHIISEHKSYKVQVMDLDPVEKTVKINLNGDALELQLQDRFDLLLSKLGMDQTSSSEAKHVAAPMPGLILEILVQPGEEVTKGTPVVVLEAMKMENVIKSPTSGIVKTILIKTGANVEKNQVLIQF